MMILVLYKIPCLVLVLSFIYNQMPLEITIIVTPVIIQVLMRLLLMMRQRMQTLMTLETF
jgi:hypothetical protein